VRLALDLEDYHPSVPLHCWLGHLTCKIVFEMTYNVSSGTLNPTITYHTCKNNLGFVVLHVDHRAVEKMPSGHQSARVASAHQMSAQDLADTTPRICRQWKVSFLAFGRCWFLLDWPCCLSLFHVILFFRRQTFSVVFLEAVCVLSSSKP